MKNRSTNVEPTTTAQTDANTVLANRCFGGDCKWRKQGESCVHCSHPKAVKYIKLKSNCKICGRKPNEEKNGCGACIGRGLYVYPFAYDDCDCGGYERSQNNVR